jgi:hypothetical protein
MTALGVYLSEIKHYNYIDLEVELAFQVLYTEDESILVWEVCLYIELIKPFLAI